MNDCLLIIDPQRDFTSPEGFYASKHKISNITNAKKNINELLQGLNNIIPVVIVYSDYGINQFCGNMSMCIPGTEGHEMDIERNDGYTYFPKKEHSAFTSSDFRRHLKSNDIKRIFIAGFLAEYCVRATAIDAIRNHFEVTLLWDCIGTGDEHQDQIDNLSQEITRSGGCVSDFRECFPAIR